jgi:excisionase family DNA binding protein
MSSVEPLREEKYPPYLTVPQVQELTQLSRGQVYRLIRRYSETDGAEGISFVRFGRLIRIPYNSLPGSDPATAERAGK